MTDHETCCPSQGWPMVYLFGILSARKFSLELIFLWPFSRATIILYSASVQIRKKNPFLKTLYCHLLDNCHNKCTNLQPPSLYTDTFVQCTTCTTTQLPYLLGSSLLLL